MEESEKLDPAWERFPKATREFTSFLHLVMAETLDALNDEFAPTYIRCFGKKCHGIIETAIDFDKNEINWRCSECEKGGVIIGIFKK